MDIIIQKTVTVDSNYGTLNYLGEGEYKFVASDSIYVDSVNAIVEYENYNISCATFDKVNSPVRGCLDCTPYNALPRLNRRYGNNQLIIKWDSLDVKITPSVVYPGDTADIVIKRRQSDGTLVDFDSTQTFEVGMLEGCALGTLLVGTSQDTGNYFYNINNPIKFVAADSLEGDSSGVVKLRVGLVEQTLLKRKNKETDKINDYCFIGSFQSENTEDADVEVEKEPIILLGETKYYQVKKNISSGKLKIEEIKSDPNGVPQQNIGIENGWEWITSDVWGDDPVSVVDTGNNCGKKMGVYWEKKYPVIDQWVDYIVISGTDTAIYKIVKMDSLQTGLIRIIGRYWTPDSTYLIKLKANTVDGDSTEINIKVIQPSKLKTDGQNPSYSYAKDALNNSIHIDSLCILFGGKYGIPPQFIKGQMLKEAATKDFGGNIGVGFAPSYRYEPYTVQFWSGIKNNNNYNKFYIKDSSYSFSNVPYHYHVLFHDYFRSIKTVWDIIEDYSQLVNTSNSNNTYGSRLSNNFMSFGLYTSIQTKYDRFKKYFLKKYAAQLTLSVIADSTNERMIKYLKDEWKNHGAQKFIAQTRSASSYGLLQMLYTTARDRGFPNDTIPENVNLLNYLELSIKTQMKYLQSGLSINVANGNNWEKGFEYSILTSIYVPKWNTSRLYAKGVYTNSQKFLPMK